MLEWNGFFAPAGMTPAIVERLATMVREATRAPEVQHRLASLGIDPVGSTPKEFANLLQGQIARWGALVRAANITVD